MRAVRLTTGEPFRAPRFSPHAVRHERRGADHRERVPDEEQEALQEMIPIDDCAMILTEEHHVWAAAG